MCRRCEELTEEVAWLRSELGIVSAATELQSARRAFNISTGQAMLLLRLHKAAGRVLSHYQLEESIPSPSGDRMSGDRIVKVYICRLRAAVGPGVIETAWGHGYRLTAHGLATVASAFSRERQRVGA